MTDDYSFLFDLLSIPNNGSYTLSNVDLSGPDKTLTIERPSSPTFCPACNSRMHSKGLYTRMISHPVFQDGSFLIIRLKQRRWRCPTCGLQFNERFPFVERYKQFTNLTPILVLDALKDLNASTRSVARRFNMSDTQVHDLFTAYVDMKRLPLTEYISIDEVYLNIDPEHNYAFVIMDFTTGEIIDIVENRRQSTLEDYFHRIPLNERCIVKGIISDAYKPYMEYVPRFFPNASSILDSFHVMSFINHQLNIYLNDLIRSKREKLKKEWLRNHPHLGPRDFSPSDTKEIILLRDYRWVLLKNERDINRSYRRYYHPKLKMNVDTSTIENMFFEIDPRLKRMHGLKEDYVSFNHMRFETEKEAAFALKILIQKYRRSTMETFEKIAQFLEVHMYEIALSFTTLTVSRKSEDESEKYYARLSNGPMESFNRKPKDYKRNARGASNFDYTRNRILWSERKDPAIRAVPKPMEQVHSYSLRKKTQKQRSKTYNKKDKMEK